MQATGYQPILLWASVEVFCLTRRPYIATVLNRIDNHKNYVLLKWSLSHQVNKNDCYIKTYQIKTDEMRHKVLLTFCLRKND